MTRPALADVLAAVTTESDPAWWRGIVRLYSLRFDGAVVLGAKSDRVAYDVGRLRHATPAGALEALVTAELLPAHWSDPERAPRWWCEACEGDGAMAPGNYGASEGDLCRSCGEDRDGGAWPRGRGVAAAPPSLPALVAVASLGVDTLARAEAIVAEAWRARVVWRVMRRVDLEAQLAAALFDAAAPVACLAASALYRRPDGPVDAYAARVDVRPIRALAALDLHLVALADGRVNLGVEALP